MPSWAKDLAIDPTMPTTLYAGTDYGMFKSTDGGVSWRAINTGLKDTNVNFLEIDPKKPATLYVGVDYGLSKSVNGGENWFTITAGLPSNPRSLLKKWLFSDPP
jgi:photosystem II stability/assembly factor-like uncharacterized protein